MMIGERLRSIRELKNMTQGDIQKRTGLMRCHISRVENGLASSAIATLEKLARALDTPLYQMLFDGGDSPKPAVEGANGEKLWGHSGKNARYMQRLRKYLSEMEDEDREIILSVLEKLARRGSRRRS